MTIVYFRIDRLNQNTCDRIGSSTVDSDVYGGLRQLGAVLLVPFLKA